MSGSPDWKPGCAARPSCSASNRKLGRLAPSSVKVSPSSIDLSGRHGGDWSRKRPRTHAAKDDRSDDQAASSKRPRSGGSIFGGGTRVYEDFAPLAAAVTTVAPQWTRSHPFAVQVAPQAMCPGGMFEPGWHIGAWFRCNLRPGFHNRVYDGPPDGTERVRLGPEEINVDFSRPYQIRALFCNHTFSAVQFMAPAVLNMDGFVKPGMLVWTNVRRYLDWWARLVDANAVGPLPEDFPGAEDTEAGSPILRDARCPGPSAGPALAAPTWRDLDHDHAIREEVFKATGVRLHKVD